ncbi:MAG: ABC transporter permease subunit [Paenibacillus sp.]|uniref:ABC transporter permease subunit n=1 Tax=Paenibacillus sp. TaxID=58172 RepID=UPI002912509E|nr:ABC transporter permease subunit [Paenibacillus sp.]MDU4696703.1 ABC transporter permease subunit [Paenibacillus sp.]
MNMFIHEWKSLRKSAIVWTLAMIALAALYLSIYPSVASDAEDFKKLLGSYPESVRAMLGIDLDRIASILGLYSMVFSIIVLCGAIQAMNLGVSILTKESRERTADFLLVKPVSRAKIVSSKLVAAVLILIATNLVFYAAAFLIANGVKTEDFSAKLFMLIHLTLFFVQLMFLAIGMASSVFFAKLRSVLPLSLGVVFGLYLIGALLASGEDKELIRFISPFKYFEPSYVLAHAGYETPYLIAAAVIIGVAVALSYTVYLNKDVHAVS